MKALLSYLNVQNLIATVIYCVIAFIFTFFLGVLIRIGVWVFLLGWDLPHIIFGLFKSAFIQ